MGTSESLPEKPAVSSPVRWLLNPVRGRLMVAAMLAAIGAMLTLVPLAGIVEIARIGLAAAQAVNAEDPGAPHTGIWRIVFASVISLVVGMAMVSAAELLAHLADNRLTHQLRLAATRRLAQVPLGWFTSRASGEVKQAMQDDIGTLHELTAHFFTTLGRSVGAVLASVVYLFAMDWRMAIVSILPFPFFFLFFGRAVKSGEANMEGLAASMGRINSALTEFVAGIPVLKSFGASGKAHGAYRDAIDDFARVFTDFTRPLVAAMAHANAMIAPVAVLGVVLIFGTSFVGLGWIAPADVLPFALVASGLSAPLLMLHYITHDLSAATGAARRVHALLETAVLEQPAPGAAQVPADAEVRFEHVGYTYDAHDGKPSPVLSGVSFTLRPGTVTAIVGASGAGKSTLARLLLRFFDPAEGRITLGGVDLRRIEPAQLYRRIGFVLQDVRLIHATVRENIALGKPSASQQEVEAAAKAACVHERILGLPRGYESVIGDDALFSGGERQRVSIARALLLDAPVLVLDEATAAADAESELAIQDALSRVAQGRTMLVIAHRLDTTMHADHIIVIGEGTICEQGSHAELLERNGHYAHLWETGGYGKRHAEQGPSC